MTNNASSKEKEMQMMSIKKEKERISSLLNQNQSNLTKIVGPSSRNSKDDPQQSHTASGPANAVNGGASTIQVGSSKPIAKA